MASTGNSALWGSLVPGGEPDGGGGIDTQEVIDRLLPLLRAEDRGHLTYWREGDLIAWIDDAIKRLARLACVFVGRDATTLTAAAQATYSLPSRHIATLHVSRGTTSLRPASQLELEALDEAYQTTPGTPTDWYADQLGQTQIGLAPVPTSEEALAIIYEGFPATLDAAGTQSLVAGPAPLKPYLLFAALAGAYGREGDMEMPEVAAQCREMMGMLDPVFQHLWGIGS